MIHVEIIAIGTEIVNGYTVNSNAAFMSQLLSAEGFTIARHTALPDNPILMEAEIRRAYAENDIVITTGGIGPTLDDLTRDVIAKVMDSRLILSQKVFDDLHRRYGNRFSIEQQSTVPEKAEILINAVGTAPGLVFYEKGKLLAVLPGVPEEMKALFTKQLLPLLQERFKKRPQLYTESVNFWGIPESDIDAVLRTLNPDLKIGIYPNQGIVTARLSANDPKDLMEPIGKLKEAFKDNQFESASHLTSEAVHTLFSKQGYTLSCAESCTGGAIAEALTQYSGASAYFLGSLVTYSNDMKHTILGVPESVLNTYGAVSKETVEAMLNGLLERTSSDWGIAVTGIAGPTGGTPEKPVGTTWCAVGAKGKEPFIWKMQFKGDRTANIRRTVNIVLGRLFHEAFISVC